MPLAIPATTERQDMPPFPEILGWFDLAAVQEVKENFGELFDTVRLMGPNYRVLMSDVGGNDERMGFVYDSTKVTLLENIGHIMVPPNDYRFIKLPGVTRFTPRWWGPTWRGTTTTTSWQWFRGMRRRR
jgi:hypothetical protein